MPPKEVNASAIEGVRLLRKLFGASGITARIRAYVMPIGGPPHTAMGGGPRCSAGSCDAFCPIPAARNTCRDRLGWGDSAVPDLPGPRWPWLKSGHLLYRRS